MKTYTIKIEDDGVNDIVTTTASLLNITPDSVVECMIVNATTQFTTTPTATKSRGTRKTTQKTSIRRRKNRASKVTCPLCRKHYYAQGMTKHLPSCADNNGVLFEEAVSQMPDKTVARIPSFAVRTAKFAD